MGENRHLRGNRNNMRWIYKIHRGQIKPPYPVLLPCMNCMKPLIEISALTVEIDNYNGLRYVDVGAGDVWMQIKHQACGAKITFYWKD